MTDASGKLNPVNKTVPLHQLSLYAPMRHGRRWLAASACGKTVICRSRVHATRLREGDFFVFKRLGEEHRPIKQ